MYRQRADEVCPVCFRVLIELRRFDARDDALGLQRDRWTHSESEIIGSLLATLCEWCGARVRQWRLDRVCRRWPNSLYCPGCGYLDRRL